MNANKQDAGGLPTATKDGDIFGPDGAVVLAAKFHDAYERLAPSFGYETRIETRLFDPDTANGRLMTAVCREILGEQCRAAPAGVETGNPVSEQNQQDSAPAGSGEVSDEMVERACVAWMGNKIDDWADLSTQTQNDIRDGMRQALTAALLRKLQQGVE